MSDQSHILVITAATRTGGVAVHHIDFPSNEAASRARAAYEASVKDVLIDFVVVSAVVVPSS